MPWDVKITTPKIELLTWLCSCVFIFATISFFVLVLGSSEWWRDSLEDWEIQFAIAIAQDIFIQKPFYVLIVYFIVAELARPQLKTISQILTKVFITAVRREGEDQHHQQHSSSSQQFQAIHS
jgi:hypothetical protein